MRVAGLSRVVSPRVLTASMLAFVMAAAQAAPPTASVTPNVPVAVEFDDAVRTEEVVIGEGAARIAGTLVMPRAPGRYPALAIITGSGAGSRFGARRFPADARIAGHLAVHGIATLLVDRRGVGGSAGDWRRETIDDRARDAVVLVEWLGRRPEVDASRTGLLGHSQGGWVVQRAAARSPAVDFIVMMAGPAETVRAQIVSDYRHERIGNGADPRRVERRARWLHRGLAPIVAAAPACRALRLHRLCSVVDYDPAPALAAVRVPVLALFAGLDPMVPPEPNMRLLGEALARSGNERLSMRLFPGANHQFWPARTGTRAEQAHLERRFVPGFLDTISGWIDALPAASTQTSPSSSQPSPVPRLNTRSESSTSPAGIESCCARRA